MEFFLPNSTSSSYPEGWVYLSNHSESNFISRYWLSVERDLNNLLSQTEKNDFAIKDFIKQNLDRNGVPADEVVLTIGMNLQPII